MQNLCSYYLAKTVKLFQFYILFYYYIKNARFLYVALQKPMQNHSMVLLYYNATILLFLNILKTQQKVWRILKNFLLYSNRATILYLNDHINKLYPYTINKSRLFNCFEDILQNLNFRK